MLLGLLAAAAIAAPPPTLNSAGSCVVAGVVPYERLQYGLKQLEKLRAAGAPNPGLYDTRDFGEMAWGQLVIVAAFETERTTADALRKTLRQNKRRTSVRKCTPTTARPITTAQPPRPLPAWDQDKEPIEAGEAELGDCLGWSPKLSAAVCIDGVTEPFHHSGKWAVRATGPTTYDRVIPQRSGQEPTQIILEEADVSHIQGAVGPAGLLSMRQWPELELSPGQNRAFARSKLNVKWRRDELVWRCSGHPWTRLAAIEKRDDATASMRVVPGERYLVVKLAQSTYGHEMSERVAHWTLDAQTCTAPKADPVKPAPAAAPPRTPASSE